MPRMDILDKSRFRGFNKPPEFSALQRKSCFDFSNRLVEVAMKFRGPSKQIGFLGSVGGTSQ